MRLTVCAMYWGRNRILRVARISGRMLNRLWANVREILRRRRLPLVLSKAIAWLSTSCFIQKIPVFVIKSRSRRKLNYCIKFWPSFFGEGRSPLFYGRFLARFTVYHLAKFGWVPFADLRLRSLAIKPFVYQNVYVLRWCRRLLVISNALSRLCISCFVPKIYKVESCH